MMDNRQHQSLNEAVRRVANNEPNHADDSDLNEEIVLEYLETYFSDDLDDASDDDVMESFEVLFELADAINEALPFMPGGGGNIRRSTKADTPKKQLLPSDSGPPKVRLPHDRSPGSTQLDKLKHTKAGIAKANAPLSAEDKAGVEAKVAASSAAASAAGEREAGIQKKLTDIRSGASVRDAQGNLRGSRGAATQKRADTVARVDAHTAEKAKASDDRVMQRIKEPLGKRWSSDVTGKGSGGYSGVQRDGKIGYEKGEGSQRIRITRGPGGLKATSVNNTPSTPESRAAARAKNDKTASKRLGLDPGSSRKEIRAELQRRREARNTRPSSQPSPEAAKPDEGRSSNITRRTTGKTTDDMLAVNAAARRRKAEQEGIDTLLRSGEGKLKNIEKATDDARAALSTGTSAEDQAVKDAQKRADAAADSRSSDNPYKPGHSLEKEWEIANSRNREEAAAKKKERKTPMLGGL